ncbi:Ribosomal protein S6 kinase alpha-2 [Branchiostoma belcheri]|nr:Ribosomal protein S6 kinase alpha-2 [Branchiostoma belcheri]
MRYANEEPDPSLVLVPFRSLAILKDSVLRALDPKIHLFHLGNSSFARRHFLPISVELLVQGGEGEEVAAMPLAQYADPWQKMPMKEEAEGGAGSTEDMLVDDNEEKQSDHLST